jgi:WD40 repeat protein
MLVSVSWSPDGRKIATASFDLTVRVWDSSGDGTSFILGRQITRTRVLQVAWSPDGTKIAGTSYDDRYIYVWSSRDDMTGTLFETRKHTTYPISAVAWSPDGSMIATTSDDACVWLSPE